MKWDITECNIIFTQVLSYLKCTLGLTQLDIYNLPGLLDDEVILEGDNGEIDENRNTLLLPYHVAIIK